MSSILHFLSLKLRKDRFRYVKFSFKTGHFLGQHYFGKLHKMRLGLKLQIFIFQWKSTVSNPLYYMYYIYILSSVCTKPSIYLHTVAHYFMKQYRKGTVEARAIFWLSKPLSPDQRNPTIHEVRRYTKMKVIDNF